MAEIKKFQTLKQRVEETAVEREAFFEKKNEELREKKERAKQENVSAFITPEDKLLEKINKLKKETDHTLNEIQLRSANGRGISDNEMMDWMRDCIALGEMEADLQLKNKDE